MRLFWTLRAFLSGTRGPFWQVWRGRRSICEIRFKYLYSWGVFLFLCSDLLQFQVSRKCRIWLKLRWSDWLIRFCPIDPGEMTLVWFELMSHCSLASFIVKQELMQCSEQLLTLLQQSNLSLLLSPRMTDLLNIRLLICTECKAYTDCTAPCQDILKLLFVCVDSVTSFHACLLCILLVINVIRFWEYHAQ